MMVETNVLSILRRNFRGRSTSRSNYSSTFADQAPTEGQEFSWENSGGQFYLESFQSSPRDGDFCVKSWKRRPQVDPGDRVPMRGVSLEARAAQSILGCGH